MTIKIEKIIHPVWNEWQQMDKTNLMSQEPLIGQYQYLLSNEKGEKISLVELPNYLRDGITLWEIYCLNGTLFDDVERFPSYEEALTASKKYLGDD